MSAINYDFAVEAGAGYLVTFTQADASNTAIPFAVGTTAEFQTRVIARATGAPLLDLTGTAGTPNNGTCVVNAAAGTITLHITDLGTRALDLPTVDSAVYAIEVKEPTLDTRRFVQGKITCSPEVVR